MRRQSVSAALIVRNEERFLPGCLKSLCGAVDEVVVVDTGSTDATRRIAVDGGARVFDFAWCDDFSAARNHAIDLATGNWILYIDADERLRTTGRLAPKLADPRMIACTVRFFPRSGCTAYREHRLFRRRREIRFEGAMHESVTPSIARVLASGETFIGSSEAVIEHLGYDDNQEHKRERNLRLLRKQIEKDSNRLYLWWHLGTVYRDMGRTADAEAAWRKGVRLSLSTPSRIPEDGLCFIELAKLAMARGSDAMPVIEAGLSLQSANYLLHWLKGKALLAGGDYQAAVPIFEALAAVDAGTLIAEVSYDKRIFGAWALAELGEFTFRMGQYDDSERWYNRAAAEAPESLELRIKLQLVRSRLAHVCARQNLTQVCAA